MDLRRSARSRREEEQESGEKNEEAIGGVNNTVHVTRVFASGLWILILRAIFISAYLAHLLKPAAEVVVSFHALCSWCIKDHVFDL